MSYSDDTLAEMHLHEYLVTLSRMVDDALKIFSDAVTHLENDDVDYQRIHSRIMEPKKRVEENRSLFMEYLIRLGEGLPNRQQYANIALGYERFVQLLDGTVYRLTLLKNRGYRIDGEVIKLISELASTIKTMFKSLEEGLEKLKTDPKKTLAKINEITRSENKADELYRELTFAIYTKFADRIVLLMVMRDAVEFMEDACDLLKSIGEELRYLALHRILIS